MHGLQERLIEVADYYLSIGLSVIPIGDDKKPVIQWGEYIEKLLPEWRFRNCNIALLTGSFNNLVVVDCDSEDSFIGWLKMKPQTPLRVKTKRGMQFYYRHPGQYIKSDSHIKDPAGFQYDVKGDRSYVVAPPSVRGGHQYSFCVCSSNIRGKLIPFEQLPVFDTQWRPERKLQQCEGTSGDVSSSTRIKHDDSASDFGFSGVRRQAPGNARCTDAIRYINTIRAIEGEGGDKATYQVACILVECGYSENEALDALTQWNRTNATPPWSEHHLRHKIKSAMREAVTA